MQRARPATKRRRVAHETISGKSSVRHRPCATRLSNRATVSGRPTAQEGKMPERFAKTDRKSVRTGLKSGKTGGNCEKTWATYVMPGKLATRKLRRQQGKKSVKIAPSLGEIVGTCAKTSASCGRTCKMSVKVPPAILLHGEASGLVINATSAAPGHKP